MGTKIDQKWAQGIRDNVNALILEVERLEGIIERIEKTIDPNPSPGGDVEWLVKNYVKNTREMMGELEKMRRCAHEYKRDENLRDETK